MRLNDLFEDIQSDKNILNEALYSWGLLCEQVKAQIEEFHLDKFEAFEKTFGDLFTVVVKRPYLIEDYDSSYVRVNFVKSNNPKKLGAFQTQVSGDGKVISQNIINLYYTTVFIDNDNDLVNLNDFFKLFEKAYKHVFIHEYTHYIDAQRVKNRDRYVATKIRQIDSGEYLNTAHEYNAHYAELVNTVYEMMGQRYFKEDMEQAKSFKDFQDNLVAHGVTLYQDLRDNLDKKFKKSFLKRLYQLYLDVTE